MNYPRKEPFRMDKIQEYSSDALSDFDESLHLTDKDSEDVSVPVHLFERLNLDPSLIENIQKAHFEHLSEIQSLTIPKALLGKDILCQGKSGTGKTAIFVLTTIQFVLDSKNRYIIVSNTPELAIQIEKEFLRFSQGMSVKIFLIEEHSLNSFPSDLESIPSICIGTISSIMGLYINYPRTFKDWSGVIIDECDELFDPEGDSYENLFGVLKFISPERFLDGDSKKKQIMVFTATLTLKIRRKIEEYLKDPFIITANSEKKLKLHGIRQYHFKVDGNMKALYAKKIVEKYTKIIIFVESNETAILLGKDIQNTVVVITTMDISERLEKIEEFSNGKFKTLISTDHLSRGIDIQDVDCVLNYDIPKDPRTYLHRIGRSGRFETDGVSITFYNGNTDIVRLNEIIYLYEIDINPYVL